MSSFDKPNEDFLYTDPVFAMNRRPIHGGHTTPQAFIDCLDELFKVLLELRPKGGMIVMPFLDQTEKAMIPLLETMAGSLLREGLSFISRDWQFLQTPFLSDPPAGTNIWFIWHATRFNNFLVSIQRWIKPGKVVIATGLVDHWNVIDLDVPFISFDYFIEKKEMIEFHVYKTDENIKWFAGNDQKKKVYDHVALFDAWGVPIPFELLARITGTDRDELEFIINDGDEAGILSWVTVDTPPAILVSTVGESVARHYLKDLASGIILSIDNYASIIRQIDFNKREERYALLKILQSWQANAKFRKELSPEGLRIGALRSFLNEFLREAAPIIRKAIILPSECLIWGQCLSNLTLFEEADKVFQRGLVTEPQNTYLLQARAHLFGKWCREDENMIPDATAAFVKAMQVDENNKYIRQRSGIFHAEQGIESAALSDFQAALSIDPSNVFVITARADYFINQGKFDRAEDDIRLAEAMEPTNVHVLHMKGRLSFILGKWEEAKKVWEENLLNRESNNPFAWQSLGHMARERGFWDEAESYLCEAYKIDPENVPVLQEMGMLFTDKVIWKISSESESDLNKAHTYFCTALEAEPGNPQISIAISVVERHLGRISEALDRLESVRSRCTKNIHAMHAQALIYHQLGDKVNRDRLFNEIIYQTKDLNLPVYISIADVAIQEKRHENADTALKNAVSIFNEKAQYTPVHKQIEALINISRLYAKTERMLESKEYLQKALELDRDNIKTHIIEKKIINGELNA